MSPVESQKRVSTAELAEIAGQEVASAIQEVVEQAEAVQHAFEESLLAQELWPSVDLLQNMGIQHRKVFGELIGQIRQHLSTVDRLKESLREGRAAFSEWLFERLKEISAQANPAQKAQQAFQELFARLEEVCRSLPFHRFSVFQHEALFALSPRDSLYVAAGKQVKRLLRRLGKRRFRRSFSVRQLAAYHLVGQLPARLFRVANLLGEAEYFLLRRVKALYEEIDQIYHRFLVSLDREEGSRSSEEWVRQAAAFRDELDESFRLVGAEIMKYYDDLRLAFEAEFDRALAQLVDDACRAGTLSLPERRFQFRRNRVESQRQRVAERLQVWGRCQIGFVGIYSMELEMVRVQNRLRHAIDGTALKVNAQVRQQLESAFEGVQRRLEETATVLRGAWKENGEVEEIRQRLEQERDRLLDFMNSEVRPRLRSLEASGEINRLIDLSMERFRQLADQTVESFQIAEEEDLPSQEGQEPTAFELKVAPVRAVVRTYLEGELIHRLGDVSGAMIGQLKEMETAIDDLWQSINFSLGNVAIELREAGKRPAELIPVALNRFQRALERFREQVERIRADNGKTEEEIVREVANTARLLRRLVLEATVREMRRSLETRRRREWRWVKQGWKRLGERMRGWRSQVKELPVEEAVGERTATEAEAGKAEALDYEGLLDLEAEMTKRVPFAYRRLFRTTPLEVSQFLAGRSGALGIIETACRRWRQGRFSSVVIIGEQGSGKTSLINCAMEQKLKGLPLVRYRITETILEERAFARLLTRLLDVEGETLDDLQEQIASSHVRRVVILEDLHRLYLRALHGLELLLRLLEFIDATGAQILWLVSLELYAWQYLEHVLQIARHFAFRIETGHLSRQELEGAIMARHRATGYRLRFAGDGDQESLRRTFFDRLSRSCGGNVFSAIFYWLRSVQKVEGDELVIGPLEELELESLIAMQLEDLLDLAMVIQHGMVSAEHFSAIFQIPLGEARARLTYLERWGILKRMTGTAGCDLYGVIQILYYPIVMQLKRRNIFR